jgi:hypothetical protein
MRLRFVRIKISQGMGNNTKFIIKLDCHKPIKVGNSLGPRKSCMPRFPRSIAHNLLRRLYHNNINP